MHSADNLKTGIEINLGRCDAAHNLACLHEDSQAVSDLDVTIFHSRRAVASQLRLEV